MTLRDEMLRAIEENIALDMDFGGVVGLNPQGMEDTADAILDLVREALLSDEVIRQVERGTHFAPRVSSVIVTAALDAATGEGDR